MRISSVVTILLVWIIVFISLVNSEYCFDPNVLSTRGGKVVNCALVTEIMTPIKNENEQHYMNLPTPSITENKNMFETTLHCSSTKEICAKVKSTFDSAGEILSSTINFVEKIKVNATFTSFCENEHCDDDDDKVVLGAAGPMRFHPMIDDDDTVRLYPQSLVKQFQYHTHLEYSQYDIGAIFNSDAKYWFGDIGDDDDDSSSKGNIEKNQFDLLYVILHELIHGLGFGSSWEQHYVGLITPLIINHSNELNDNHVNDHDYNNNKGNAKFVEWAFDKHIILIENGTKISSITQDLNGFFDHRSLNNIGSTQRDFEINFYNSKQFIIAKQMFELSQTPNTIGFLLERKDTDDLKEKRDLNKDIVILETSFNPFRVSSSISHIDNSIYSNTEDFLMRSIVLNGITLQQEIINGGNYSGGPVGPKLKRILETIGYPTKENPISYKPRVIDPNSIDTSSVANSLMNNIYYLDIAFTFIITLALHLLL